MTRGRGFGVPEALALLGIAAGSFLVTTKGPEIYDSLQSTEPTATPTSEPVLVLPSTTQLSVEAPPPTTTPPPPDVAQVLSASTRAAVRFVLESGRVGAVDYGACTTFKIQENGASAMLTDKHCINFDENRGVKLDRVIVGIPQAGDGNTHPVTEAFGVKPDSISISPVGELAVLRPSQDDPVFAAIPALNIASQPANVGDILTVTGYGAETNPSQQRPYEVEVLGYLSADQYNNLISGGKLPPGTYGVTAPVHQEGKQSYCVGGYSGSPLADKSTEVVGNLYGAITFGDNPNTKDQLTEVLGPDKLAAIGVDNIASFGKLCVFNNLAGQSQILG